MQLLCILFFCQSDGLLSTKHTKTQLQIHMKKHQFPSEQLFLFPESIWWQHTQHLAPPLFFLLLDRKSLLHSSGHQSPDSVNKSIYSHPQVEMKRKTKQWLDMILAIHNSEPQCTHTHTLPNLNKPW